jgi:hypothetical protein
MLSAGIYLFSPVFIAQYYPKATYSSIMVCGVISIVGVISAILILFWRKIGFWGFAIINAISFFIMLSWGFGFFQSIFGMISLIICFAVLKIRKNSKTTWEQLN